jgi:cation diffusion facilitator CzcD-associated flavoprotein CzcO
MPDTANIPNVRPKRILIIGGGASGLVTLRNLLDRGEFDDVQLVERRDDVGGVWWVSLFPLHQVDIHQYHEGIWMTIPTPQTRDLYQLLPAGLLLPTLALLAMSSPSFYPFPPFHLFRSPR